MTAPTTHLSTWTTDERRSWAVIHNGLPCCREQTSREAALQAIAHLRLSVPAPWPVWDGDTGAFLAVSDAEQLR